MIRLRSNNLVDYKRMRRNGSNPDKNDISYIENGWLIGRGSNYGTMIVDLSEYTFKQNDTHYIVADVECVYAGKVRNFSAIQLYDTINSITGSLVVGKQLHIMSVGERQRVVYKCFKSKISTVQGNRIIIYNSYNPSNPDNSGDSFKITNLCFFKEDYTIDYVPYWYDPQKIMTRTRNLFVPSYNSNVTKEDNGFVLSGWAVVINTHETCLKMFKPNKTYTLSFDLEFIETPPYNYSTQALGFNFYDATTKKVLSSLTTYIQPSQITVGNKIHFSFTRTMPADLANATLLAYSGYCRNADENNKWYYTTARFANIMLTEGSTEVDYVPYMSEVKTIAWGVKDECKLVLDGSEKWLQYAPGNWVGAKINPITCNVYNLRDVQYNNYWGFTIYDDFKKYLWLQRNSIFIAWTPNHPPFSSWETTDADGKAIANIPQIKADLAKKNLVVYYDNMNAKPKTLAELLKIVRREVYNNFSATVDSDILTLTNSSVENNVLILPDDKTVTNNVLNL